MRFRQPTIDYAARRITACLSKKDDIRCLKPYLVREVYHRVMTGQRTRQPTTPQRPKSGCRGVNAVSESFFATTSLRSSTVL